jgi:arylsulfatase A-like enzyme
MGEKILWVCQKETPHLMQKNLFHILIFLFAIFFFFPSNLLLGGLGSNKVFAEQKRYKVLFLTIDSLRADFLSCYGYHKKTSPNIDNLCEEAILFKNFYAVSGWTSPTLVSIFSSLLPSTHGVEVRGYVLNSNIKTPVEVLKDNGWKTYAEHWTGDTIGNLGFDFSGNNIFEFLDKHKDEDFFVWFHLRGPHLPYSYLKEFSGDLTADFERIKIFLERKTIYKEEFDLSYLTEKEKDFIRTLYEADIKLQDDEIGKIVEHLKNLGIWDEVILVITADHGEELFEHGWVGHASTSRDSGLYQEIMKIPCIIRIPGIKRYEVETPASSVDIMPTLFEILGLGDQIKEFSSDGERLISFDQKKKKVKVLVKDKNRTIFASTSPCGWQCKESEKWKRVFVIQEGEWKLIYYNYKGDSYEDRFELFKLPDESKNLALEEKKMFRYMVEKLFRKISETKIKSYELGGPEKAK